MCHNINGKRDFLSIFNVCSKYCADVWCGHILLLALFWEFRTFWPTLGSFRRIKPVFYMLFFASERRFGKMSWGFCWNCSSRWLFLDKKQTILPIYFLFWVVYNPHWQNHLVLEKFLGKNFPEFFKIFQNGYIFNMKFLWWVSLRP